MMCVNIRTDYRLHWSQDPLFENVEVRKMISRDEFRTILRHSHPSPNQLAKLANKSFQQHWKPYSHVSIDESLICFKGRYQHRVHIRGKPDATGLKIYGLADQMGYMYAFDLYKGDKASIPEIVMGLLGKLPSTNFVLLKFVSSCHLLPSSINA